MKELQFYKPLDTSPTKGLVLSLLIVLICTPIPACIYALFIAFFPIIYVNIVALSLLIYLLYDISRIAGKIGKIRNKKHLLILAGVTGAFTLYFSWIGTSYFVYHKNNDIGTFFSNECFSFPLNKLADDISIAYTYGTWGIFGVNFKGLPLFLIWISEALAMIVVPVLITYFQNSSAFSEQLNKWFVKYELDHEFEFISSQNLFYSELKEKRVQAIDELKTPSAFRFSKISIFYLPNEISAYLSIDNKLLQSKNGISTKNYPVIKLLQITPEEAELLIKKYRGKKTFYFNR